MMIKVITYLLLMQKVDGISVSDSLDGLKKVQPVIGSDIFDVVVDYGAVGDGKTDDTDALQAALDDCAASRNGGGTIKLGKEYEFLSLPLTVTGSGCALMIEGKLTQKYWEVTKKSAFITIDGVDNFLLYGGGMINGSGPLWWIQDKDDEDVRPKLFSVKGPSSDLALLNITLYNSPDHTCEVYADNSEIAFVNISVDWYIDDGHAPNTDGVDVHGTPFYIHDCIIDVGDDNIAIHASDVLIENCIFGSDNGPTDAVHGHGASIGSLGSDTFLSNITVRDSVFKGTIYGPRIKVHDDATNGHVHDIIYENLYIDSVQKGIYVTAEYTLDTTRADSNKPFILSDISFKNITMINTDTPGYFECSKSTPCLDFHLTDITAVGNSENDWSCTHIYGTQDNVSPKSCIRSDHPSSYSYSYSYENDDTASNFYLHYQQQPSSTTHLLRRRPPSYQAESKE
mmetsp:Transcript_10453/g.14437  ORF Transcript_10453/g.14437 Transcript_10453/m.14437 type:complete len:455 (-) Transcript_10453:227-1591(-)